MRPWILNSPRTTEAAMTIEAIWITSCPKCKSDNIEILSGGYARQYDGSDVDYAICKCIDCQEEFTDI